MRLVSTLALAVLPVVVTAQESGELAEYRGYRVAVGEAKAQRYLKVRRPGGREHWIDAGEGHALVIVRLSFSADEAPASAGEWLDDEDRGRIRRSEVALHATDQKLYRPMSMVAQSWKDWAPSDESIPFDRNRVGASKSFLFWVPQGFDWQNARIRLGDQSLAVKLEEWPLSAP